MLKVLIKKQITEILVRTFRKRARKNGTGTKRSGIGTVLMLAIAGLYLVGFFAAASVGICKDLLSVELSWLYYLLVCGAAVIFGTFGSVFSTCFTLYMAKDNDLLLSLPIPVGDIILSRLFGVYFMSLLYSGLITVPAVVVGWVIGGFSFPKLIGGLVLVFLVSLIVMALSCLLGLVVAKISQKLKNRSFLTVLVALIFLGLYYFVYFKIMGQVGDLLTFAVPLGRRIEGNAYPIYILGRIGEGHWLGMLYWTAGVFVLLDLIWLLLKKTFLSISTATPTPKRAEYRETETVQRSPSAALFRKEWNRFSKSANYMLNCGMPLLLQVGFGGYMLFKGNGLVEAAALVFGKYKDVVPVLLCSACCMLGGMVDVSAPSVSLEGKTLWQAQCLPVSAWQVLRAKLALHLALAAFPTVFCTAVMAALAPATTLQRLLMLAVSCLNTGLFALLGLFFGIRMPNLSWTNEIVPIKQSAPVLLVIFSGIGLSLAFGGLYLWFGWHIGATAWLAVFTGLLLTVDLRLYFWLKGPGARRFEAL